MLTRDADVTQSVVAVSEFANAQSPDLFVSIHLNNAEGTSANKAKYEGAEIYVAAKDKAVNYDANYKLANNLAATLQEAGTPINGVKTRNNGIWVLQAVQCPSALIEAGYITNNKELAKIKDAGYQQKLAASILKGIENYLSNQERGTGNVLIDTAKKLIIVQGYKISPEDTLIASKEKGGSFVIKMDGAGAKTNGQKPMYVLDGEVISESVMSVIDPNKIEAINVLKGPSATALYGDKGKDGVILITTKQGNAEKASKGPIVVQGYKVDSRFVADTVEAKVNSILIKSNNLSDAKSMSKNMDEVIVLQGNSIVIKTEGKKVPALIFVDGEKKTQKEIDAMSPDQIKSVEILKGDAAIKAYGAEAKDGVIKITTKKKVNL